MVRVTQRRSASYPLGKLIPACMIVFLGACATTSPTSARSSAFTPVQMRVSAEPTSADGWTGVWVHLTNNTKRDVSFTMAVAYRVAEDPTTTYSYASPEPAVACETGTASTTFGLVSDGTFAVRIDVPTPSPVAERVLISADIEFCSGAEGAFRVYDETPLSTGALAEHIARAERSRPIHLGGGR